MSYSQLHISLTFERYSDDRQVSKSLKYNCIPKQISRKDFNHYIKPHLSKRIKGPKPKLSFYKIFNISSMFYIRVFNGINSEHGVINSIGLTSINGIINGQKMVLMSNFLKHLSYIFRRPTSLTQLNSLVMVQIPSSKKGNGTGYSGHKHQKGERELTITDNNGYAISPITVKPVNEYDCTILPEAFTELITFTERIGLDLSGSALTLDSGFDTKANHKIIKEQGLLPVIYPNRRNAKEPIVIARKFRWFRKDIYKDRYKVERTFGWQDTYRKLVLSYDKLKETRLGFRHLAYSMINFRVAFNDT